MWLQYILVGLIVTAAVLFAIWRLPGHATRQRYVSAMRRIGGTRGPLAWLAARLQARLDRALRAGGCAACGTSTGTKKGRPR